MYKVIRTAYRVLVRFDSILFESKHGSLRWPLSRLKEAERLASVYGYEVLTDPEDYIAFDALLDWAIGSSPQQRAILFARAEEQLC